MAGWLLVSFAALAFITAPTLAVTTISQGYQADDKLPLGALVSLKDNTSDHVVSAVSSNVNGLLGVVINNDSSLLSVSSDQGTQVMVATSGIAQVLVSDINGEINNGDQITASPIKSVGMKATNTTKIVGIAQGKATGSSKQTYKDKDGKEHSLNLGEAPVAINVAYYFKQPDKTLIPPAIQNIANALAGKKVDSLPIIISAAIFLVTLIVVVSIIYSMIKSSIVSVGRNPMSQSAIYRDMIQLSSLVLIIIGVAFGAIYLILRRF